jgi:biotin-dependent carboxylase-like uncharacterized protein
MQVTEPGPFTTVQDLGRPPRPDIGLGRSGAADRGSLRLANRLVGNRSRAAALEMTMGGLTVTFHRGATVAITGAPCPLRVDGRAVAMWTPVHVPAGSWLQIDTPEHAFRSYLAVRGGIDVPEVLGSRSTDVLAGLGGRPLQSGDRLPIGDLVEGPEPPDLVDVAPQRPFAREPVLHVVPGPRLDWFVPEALEVLLTTSYRATSDSNRVGVRLEGEPLQRRLQEELPSEGMVHGALQVPPSGQPALFLTDHPMTGGYPVIAVVADDSLDLAAQLRPGQTLRFRPDPTLSDQQGARP